MRADVASLDKRLSEPDKLLPPNYLLALLRSEKAPDRDRTLAIAAELHYLIRTLSLQEKNAKDQNAQRQITEEFQKRIETLLYDLERGL